MNFSKLNPWNWFRRDAPPDPTATGFPKYKVGQHCLVIKYPAWTQIIGHEVILSEPLSHFVASDQKTVVGEWAWITDMSRPVYLLDGTQTQVVFPEGWLIPIDDENVNEELRNEVIDNFGTSQIELDQQLKRLDKSIEQLEEALKQKRERKQAI